MEILDSNKLYREIYNALSKVCTRYNFYEIDDNFVEEFITNKINKNLSKITNKESFISFVKKRFIETLVAMIKTDLNNDDKFILIIENYIDKNCNFNKTVNDATELLNKISLFFSTIEYNMTLEKTTLLITKIPKIQDSIKIILEKYQSKYKSKIYNHYVISYIDVYCIMNNIIFEDDEELCENNSEEHNLELEINDSYDDIYSEDIVKDFLVKSRMYPLLSREEEAALFKRVRDGDQEARTLLYQCNQRLVVNIAKRYLNRGVSFMDLIQEGSIGLMTAIDRFDFSTGNKLSSYSIWWIKQAIQRAILEQGRNIRIPNQRLLKISRMTCIENELTVELNREPTLEELSKRTGYSISEILKLKEDKIDTVSYNAKINDDDEEELQEFFGASELTPYDEYIKAEERNKIRELMDLYLSEREKKVLMLRFGFDSRAQTLEEIGCRFGLTRERIRQIERKAIGKLKNPALACQLIRVSKESFSQIESVRSKSIYDYFDGYDVLDVNNVYEELSYQEKNLIEKKLNSQLYTIWTDLEEIKFWELIKRMQDRILKKINIRNNLKSTSIVRKNTFYEFYLNYSIDEINLAISHLGDKERQVLFFKYGNDLLNPDRTTYWSQEYNLLFQKARRLVQKELNVINETLYSYFYLTSKSDLDKTVSKLNEEDKAILRLRYGEDFSSPEQSYLWKIEFEDKLSHVKQKLSALLRSVDSSTVPNFYDCFKGYNKDQVDYAIGIKCIIDQNLYQEFVGILMNILGKEELAVISCRYGIRGTKPMSISGTGKVLNISNKAVTLFETSALNKLCSESSMKVLNEYMQKFYKVHEYRGRGTIYNLCKNSSIAEVNDVIDILSEDEKELIRLKYGDDLLNPCKSKEWTNEHTKRFNELKFKIRRILNQNTLFYSLYPNYSKKEIQEAILKLDHNDIILLEKTYFLGIIKIDDDFSKKSVGAGKVNNIKKKIAMHLCGRPLLEYKSQQSNSKKKEKDVSKDQNNQKEITRKTKTLYDYFQGTPKETIDKIVNQLSINDKKLLYIKFGEDLISNNKHTNVSFEQIYNIIQKIKRRLNKITKEKSIYDSFKKFSTSQVDQAINELSNSDKIILASYYHLNGVDVLEVPEYDMKRIYLIREKIRRILIRSDKAKEARITIIKGFYEYFQDYSKEDVDEALLHLSERQLNLLRIMYGDDLSSNTHSSDESYPRSYQIQPIFKRIHNILSGKGRKIKIDFELNGTVMNEPGHTINNLETTIFRMRYSDNYTISQIAKLLHISELEVIDILRKILTIYKSSMVNENELSENIETSEDIIILSLKKSVENK